MLKLSLPNKIDLAFAVAAVLFISLFSAIYSAAVSVRQNRAFLLETTNVNAVLEKILTSTVDIETGSRGYTITGKDSFLRAYRHGNRNLAVWLDSLSHMNPEAHGGRQRLDSLRELLATKQEVASRIVATRRVMGERAAMDIVASEIGNVQMDRVRAFIHRYQSHQVAQLANKLRETSQSVRLRDSLFILFVVATFLLGLFGYIKIRQTAMRTVQSERMQRKLSHKMALQNRQLKDFATITSHNLRAPASNITALVGLIREDSTVEEYRNVFEMLKKVSVNLNDTLNELIEVLHVKKNTGIEREELRFQDLFVSVLENLQGQILSKEATVTANFSQAPQVRFPKIYLESILQNLISNALKYSSPERRPEIHVSTTALPQAIVLAVSDNGLGIDLSKYGHKIFGMHQIFHRNEDAKGIGLFMTKTQVEAMGGKIWVESDGVNGSTFKVQFAL